MLKIIMAPKYIARKDVITKSQTWLENNAIIVIMKQRKSWTFHLILTGQSWVYQSQSSSSKRIYHRGHKVDVFAVSRSFYWPCWRMFVILKRNNMLKIFLVLMFLQFPGRAHKHTARRYLPRPIVRIKSLNILNIFLPLNGVYTLLQETMAALTTYS